MRHRIFWAVLRSCIAARPGWAAKLSWEHPQWLRLLTIPAGGIVRAWTILSCWLPVHAARYPQTTAITLRFLRCWSDCRLHWRRIFWPVLSTKGKWQLGERIQGLQKVSGIWVEQSDIANLFSTDTNYVKGWDFGKDYRNDWRIHNEHSYRGAVCRCEKE